ncbi:MAG: phosphoenolpyruvate--protein phosphotransferase [Spirochaetota bacterium]
MGKKARRPLLDRTAELTKILDESTNLRVFLTDLAKLVAGHMAADACSFFIYNDDHRDLTLQGTAGLDASFVGKLRFREGEGITGLVMETLQPIRADRASTHPHFKPIPGIGEEPYESLLAVPIRRAREKIGVITLHKRESSYFDDEDIEVLMTIAAQLASSVMSAGLLLALRSRKTSHVSFHTPIEGKGASPGIVFGRSLYFNRQQFFILDSPQEDQRESTLDYSEDDFDTAVEETVKQLHQIEQRLGESLSDIAGLIFTAHYLMLKDPEFTGAIRKKIKGGMSADKAIRKVSDAYAQLMTSVNNPRIQEKEQDVRDLEHRMLANLYQEPPDHRDCSENVIIASAIYPSELVRMWVQKAKAIVLIGQGLTAHISILARSLEIPLLLVYNKDLHQLPNNTPVIADATQGMLHIDPDKKIRRRYAQFTGSYQEVLPKQIPKTTVTRDGVQVKVHVNVNILHDAEAGKIRQAEGIGLYRTEFPFLIQNSFPSEEQQVQVYEKICASAGEKPVVFRTLDIGGDKLPGYVDITAEDNPFLGFRGIRYSLEAKDIFREQIRAGLRAGANSNLCFLFPMISSLDEFIQGREEITLCIKELRDSGIPHCEHPNIGAMVEIPSAVDLSAELAQEADFLSVGTNDLIMYLLAVDRSNEYVGQMHTAFHPSVLRTLNRLADSVRGVRPDDPYYLSVCGDAAADPLIIPFLIGIGITNISVEPSKLIQVKTLVQELTASKCHEFAERLLQARTTEEINQIATETYWCSV